MKVKTVVMELVSALACRFESVYIFTLHHVKVYSSYKEKSSFRLSGFVHRSFFFMIKEWMFVLQKGHCYFSSKMAKCNRHSAEYHL